METSIVLAIILLGICVYYSKTDQPVRYMTVLIFAPYIIWKGYATSDILLLAFGIGLLVWDLYCILRKSPVRLQC